MEGKPQIDERRKAWREWKRKKFAVILVWLFSYGSYLQQEKIPLSKQSLIHIYEPKDLELVSRTEGR